MSRGEPQRHPHEGQNHSDRDATQWQNLRELLIGPEKHQLDQVMERLDDPVRRSDELGEALPDAITIGTSRSDRIARALQPTIDTALKISARKNPKAIAEAIFPALGPAIRKAISAALMGMIQSLNHVLNQSFSFRGLRWRLEAIRTKKTFAEVVLLHTLVYRVEQIFLIHRRSGILIQHAQAAHDETKDPDLVSGMLTAIQDFVKDSFDTRTGEILDTLRMDGDHSVWIEQGPYAVLATVIRGMPPMELRTRFRELLDRIHRLFGDKLDEFQGQTSAFAMIAPDLEDALAYQTREDSRHFSPLLWILMAAGLALVAGWSWRTFKDQREWATLLSQLRAQRGIVVTSAEKAGGEYIITGLKDPLSGNAEAIIAASGIDRARIRSHWQPFYALDDITVLERARRILNPPPAVKLELVDGKLEVTGSASHQWVRELRRRAGTIPGIQLIDDNGLLDREMNALRSAIEDLHRQVIYFDPGQWQIANKQAPALSAALETIGQVQSMSRSMDGVLLRIVIVARTDPPGGKDFNLNLSQRRAQAVMNYLIQNHIDPVGLQAVGATTPAPETEPKNLKANAAFRAVTFKTLLRNE